MSGLAQRFQVGDRVQILTGGNGGRSAEVVCVRRNMYDLGLIYDVEVSVPRTNAENVLWRLSYADHELAPAPA